MILCTHIHKVDGNTTLLESAAAPGMTIIIGSFSAVVVIMTTLLLVLVIILIVFGVVYHKRMKNSKIHTTENPSYPANQIQASNAIAANNPPQNLNNNNDSEPINLPSTLRHEPPNTPHGEPPNIPRCEPHAAVPREPQRPRPRVPVKPTKPKSCTPGHIHQPKQGNSNCQLLEHNNTGHINEIWNTDKDGYEIINDQSY